MDDLSKEEILEILNIADQLKYELKHNMPHEHLKGKTLVWFLKNVLLEQEFPLKQECINLEEMHIFKCKRPSSRKREAVEDTARVLSRFYKE